MPSKTIAKKVGRTLAVAFVLTFCAMSASAFPVGNQFEAKMNTIRSIHLSLLDRYSKLMDLESATPKSEEFKTTCIYTSKLMVQNSYNISDNVRYIMAFRSIIDKTYLTIGNSIYDKYVEDQVSNLTMILMNTEKTKILCKELNDVYSLLDQNINDTQSLKSEIIDTIH